MIEIASEPVAHTRNQPMKSMLVCLITCIMLSLVTQPRFSATSKITWATKTEVKMLMAVPSHKVTAKPLIWSVPIT